MSELEELVSKYDCECLESDRRIKENELSIYEKELDVKFGSQLKEYILKYGYIAYKYIELYGINSTQGINSDMISASKMLHNLSEQTRGLIAIENQGDGDYYLVDSNDNMYELILDESLSLVKQDITLFKYIETRLESIEQ